MSSITAPSAPALARASAAPVQARVGFGSLVRAEWISLSSLRGNRASLIVGLLLMLLPAGGLAVLYGYDYVDTGRSAQVLEWIPGIGSLGMNGMIFAVALAVLVGAASYAKEHSTGSLRSQLAAAPRRIGTLSAKALVVGGAVFIATVAGVGLAFAVAAVAYAVFGVPITVGLVADEFVLPALGAGLSAALVAVFALGVAALLRSETWAVTSVLIFFFVVPIIFMQLPWEWAPSVADLLLGSTTQTLWAPTAVETGEAIRDLVVSIGWTAAAFATGAAIMSRRDA